MDLVGVVRDHLLAFDDEIDFGVHVVDSVGEAGAVVWAELAGVIADAAQECGRYNKALARLGLDDGTSEKWLKEHNLYPTEPKDINPRKFVQDYGVKVELLTADEIAAFRAKMNPVFDKWVDKIGKDLVNAAQEDMKNAAY